MQTIINSSFGLGVGFALYPIIGLPCAILWGFLAAVLRFIPYVGPLAAAIHAQYPRPGGFRRLAVADRRCRDSLFGFGTPPVICVGLEPLLYGESAGISGVGLVVAIAFWTWL